MCFVFGEEKERISARDRLAFVRGHMHRCLNTGATAYSWPIFPQPPHAASQHHLRARTCYVQCPSVYVQICSLFWCCVFVEPVIRGAPSLDHSKGNRFRSRLISRPVPHYWTAPIAEPGRLSHVTVCLCCIVIPLYVYVGLV